MAQDIFDTVEEPKTDIFDSVAEPEKPSRNAAGALIDVAKGFIPHSLSDALGLATPAYGGVQEIIKAGKTVGDVISGTPLEQAVEQNIPESQIIKQAETTPPYSRERFRAGFETLAGLGMAAAGGRGLSETLFPVERPVSAVLLAPEVPLSVRTPEERIIANATQEGIKPESYQPEYQGNAPSGPPAETGGRGVVEQRAQEQAQEVGGRADVMALAEEAKTAEPALPEVYKQAGIELNKPEAAPPMTVEAYRGDAISPVGEGAHKFYSESEQEASGYGKVSKERLTFQKPLHAENWLDAKEKLGLPQTTTMPDLLDAAAAAGHDGIVWRHHGKTEYVKLEADKPTQPLSITSIKNEQVDSERATRGLPSVVEPARKAFGESWDEASKQIDSNPSYPDQLIEELKTKPRALTDVEDATLLHRQVDLQNQYQKAAATLFKARDAGDDIGKLEANGRVNALSDQLLELYDVGKKAGTETGRGLAARKLLAAEDFSLANMITQKRAALQGEQLSDAQVEAVTKAKNKVSVAQLAYDAYETSPKAEGYRKRLRTLTEQYKARTEAGDFEPRQRTPIPLDRDLEARKADLARAKKDWYTELAKDKAKNRTASQKFWDRFVGVERAMKLSSDVVLAKLTTAAAVREGVLTPVEEAVGGAVSKVLPGLAKRAPREGGFSPEAEIRAKADMFTTGMKDAWQNLKMKQTDLDELYKSGKIKAPEEFYDYLGYLHGALKAPIKRAEFARSLTKRMRWEVENGGDLNNVNTMRNLSEQAYVDANRSIFLQDNILSDLFTAGLRQAENYKKAPNLGPAAARIGRFLIPIVKVPTNIVGEVATGVHGVATGGTRAAMAYIKGIDSLPISEGDAIMRQLKKGLVGNSILLAGYFGYESIGGFYHDQDKRTEADIQPGRYRVGNVDIPASAGHSTGAMLLNIGATVHRVQDERIRKAESETKGVGEGLRAAGAGLAHEVPFVPAVTGIIEAMDSKHGFEKYIMNMIGSTTTPALVTHVAKTIDTPGTFPSNILQPATPRKPTTPLEAVEATIPGLRERVPERKAKGSRSSSDYVR